AAHPESGFLRSFVEPVRDYQASQIEVYFKAGDSYRALSFFEKNRSTLFPKVPADLAARLFVSYADVFNPAAAAEFWDAYQGQADTDLKVLRQATIAAELAAQTKPGRWRERDRHFQRELPRRRWQLKPDAVPLSYA